MKLLLCILLLLFPIQVHANDEYDLDIIQDEYNNLVISSSDLDYLNAINSVEFYDGESTITVELNKDSFNSSIDSDLKTLTIYISTLINVNRGNYQVYLNANGYEKQRADEMGCFIDKKVVVSPNDVLVQRNENGLEIRSKVYNYIHGLTLEYKGEYSLETYSYIQFSTFENFEESTIYENSYAKIPFSNIYVDNGYYCVSLSNEALKSMGFEEGMNYYVQVQSASFKEKVFGSYLLVEKSEEQEDESEDEIIDEELDETVDENKPIVDNDEVEEQQNKKKDDSDLYIAIACFISLIICAGIGTILYTKNKLKK